ncbi:PTS transporter subunit EIIC [Spiroplasma endosymbiont of Cantharis lateralis]|uniref:PTS transporter subunit EIIC n=1 Tax=Spiroplasma endosymbiont of Cantharis lateralis TaxID=3066277 RepID=UPI00313E6D39
MNDKSVHLTNEKKLKTKKVKDSNSSSSGWSKFLTMLQELGKVLQFPIAVLPFAAILNRFGALGITYSSETINDNLVITNQIGYWISLIIQKPGSIPFDNLALLFAIGCAFGLAKDHRGEVALVAVIFYLSIAALTGEGTLPEMLYGKLMTFTDKDGHSFSKLLYVQKIEEGDIAGGVYVLSTGVLGGIVSGCLSAFLYNRFKDIKLPTALSFFGGRRFVPMIALVVTIPTALAFAIIWPWIQLGLISFGTAVANPENPAVAIPGTTAYSILNRLLLPFGLHQIMNTFFWFQMPVSGNIVEPGFGSIPTVGDPTTVMGDINAFAKGISNSGLFQAGFFPIMMGGLPMAAVAMIMTADKNNRKEIAGFLGGVAGVSFLSGITEPLEFSFVFIAPVLLGIHAGLTGIFMAITTAMKIQIGFGFSAGFIDYAASLPQSWALSNNQGTIVSNPLWILVLTAAAGATYYFVFYFVIKWMNLSTPGRNVEAISAKGNLNTSSKASTSKEASQKGDKYENMASKIVEAIGKDNFVSIDNCATRLRLILKDNSKIDDALIKSAGTYGIKRLGNESLQIVIGPDVEHAANALKKIVEIKETKEVKK